MVLLYAAFEYAIYAFTLPTIFPMMYNEVMRGCGHKVGL